jgi:hypothetical protein
MGDAAPSILHLGAGAMTVFAVCANQYLVSAPAK